MFRCKSNESGFRSLIITRKRKSLNLLPTVPMSAKGRAELFSADAFIAESSAFFARTGETTVDPAFIGPCSNPIDFRVRNDHGVVGVNHNDFKPLVFPILQDKIGVQYFQIGKAAPCSLFRDPAVTFSSGNLHNTHISGLPTGNWARFGPSSLPHAGPNYDITLLCLVPEGSCAI